jgi:hypothetical protein
MISAKLSNSSVTKSKDIEMVEMPDEDIKSLILKNINGLKGEATKQMNEVKKSVQDLLEKFTREILGEKNKWKFWEMDANVDF